MNITEHKVIDGQRYAIIKDDKGRVLAQVACTQSTPPVIDFITTMVRDYWVAGDNRRLDQQQRDDILVTLAMRLLR